MKTYSIGRDLNCDIIINDNTDVISRRHALLNVMPSGKMTIIDQSSNGTYVNGIRISPNVPVPVSRKDTVSLAHVARLDWNMVPRPNAWIKYLLIAVAVIAAIIAGVVIYNNRAAGSADNPDNTTVVNDSIKKKAEADSLKKKQAEDTTKKSKQNVAPAKKDSAKKGGKRSGADSNNGNNSGNGGKNNGGNKQSDKESKDKTGSRRTLG